MESIWQRETRLPQYKRLSGDEKADAVVIGGGITGILCAYQLAKTGRKVILLEKGRIASKTTAYTTAKVTIPLNLFCTKLLNQAGPKKAQAVLQLYLNALDEMERIIEENAVSCDWKRLPVCLYSHKNHQLLKQELSAASALGLKASYREKLDFFSEPAAVLRFDNQAQMNPLAFLSAVINRFVIYENSEALRFGNQKVYTKEGSVKAGLILFACHYPIINAPGYYFTKLYQERSCVLALSGVPARNAMFYGIDADGLALRWHKELLLVSGESYRTGENSAGMRYEKLLEKAQCLFPQAKELYRWSTQDCMSLDGLPYIGTYAAAHQNWFVATGFNKWGMLSAMVSALLIKSYLSTGNSLAYEALDSLRSGLESPLPLWEQGAESAKGLFRAWFKLPSIEAEKLPVGHGGIVSAEGQKVGIYRESETLLHAVLLKCPHLGCQLEWNPDEKSWDCPCHGSRFDFRGRILDNPAQQALEYEEIDLSLKEMEKRQDIS